MASTSKEIIFLIKLLVLAVLILLFFMVKDWWDTPHYVQSNTCQVANEDLKKIMNKVGPYYSYMIDLDGNIFVNKGDEKWLKINSDQ